MIQGPSYFVPDRADDWVERVESACRVLEACCGTTLMHAVQYQRDKPDVVLDDRPRYLRQRAKTRTRWLSLHNGVAAAYDREATPVSGHCGLGGCSYGNAGVYNVSVTLPPMPVEAQEQVLLQLGDALDAHSSQWWAAPWGARLRNLQFAVPPAARPTPALDVVLPTLHDGAYFGLVSPFQPLWLGWLNYWSAETAAFLGFPDPSRDGALLAHAQRTPRGAWLVRLGTEPFSASSAQLSTLASAYARFPAAGLRSRPTLHATAP